MFAILEFPDGPALCVGYRTRSSAVAALERLRATGSGYAEHIVVQTSTAEEVT
jgi:hypothetical protein